MENGVFRGVLGWGRCPCLEANMDTDGLHFPDGLLPLARPHMAGMEGDHWRPLAEEGECGVRIGVAFRTHPLRVHFTKQELQTPSLWSSVPLPLMRMKHPSYRQFGSQNKRLNLHRAGTADEGLAVKFAAFTNFLVLVLASSPAPGPHVWGGTSPKYPGWI